MDKKMGPGESASVRMGGEAAGDDDVEGHGFKLRADEDEQDTEGQGFKLRADEDDKDTEGQGFKLRADEDEQDTEGHRSPR